MTNAVTALRLEQTQPTAEQGVVGYIGAIRFGRVPTQRVSRDELARRVSGSSQIRVNWCLCPTGAVRASVSVADGPYWRRARVRFRGGRV